MRRWRVWKPPNCAGNWLAVGPQEFHFFPTHAEALAHANRRFAEDDPLYTYMVWYARLCRE
jgi:hypothetical protein